MENYKIDYERINELYTDPDQRMRVLRKAKDRVSNLSLEEETLWFKNWGEAYFKSKAYERSRQSFNNYIRKYLNRQARKKVEADPRFNQIKVTKSAYEKAKYISKRVIELNREKQNLEVKFYPIYDKGSDVINDFYIPFQRVNGVSCWSVPDSAVLYAHSIGKESYGWAHSHADMSTFHSAGDKRFTKFPVFGLESILDFCNGDEEKNKRFNFGVRYTPSIVFNAKMTGDPNIKPCLGVGVKLDKLDESGGRKRGEEFIFNENVQLEIIEDNKEIDKKTIDQEILERVKTYRDINEVLEPGGIPWRPTFKIPPVKPIGSYSI